MNKVIYVRYTGEGPGRLFSVGFFTDGAFLHSVYFTGATVDEVSQKMDHWLEVERQKANVTEERLAQLAAARAARREKKLTAKAEGTTP